MSAQTWDKSQSSAFHLGLRGVHELSDTNVEPLLEEMDWDLIFRWDKGLRGFD